MWDFIFHLVWKKFAVIYLSIFKCYFRSITVTVWQLHHPWRARHKPRFYFWRAQHARKNKENKRPDSMQCLEECCLRARLRIDQDFHEFAKTSFQVAENVVVPVWTSSCSSRLSTCFWTAALRRFLFVCNLAPPNLSAAACQHVDPTIACETFWQHQNKNNRPQAVPYVVVIYVIWRCMCAGRQC